MANSSRDDEENCWMGYQMDISSAKPCFLRNQAESTLEMFKK